MALVSTLIVVTEVLVDVAVVYLVLFVTVGVLIVLVVELLWESYLDHEACY